MPGRSTRRMMLLRQQFGQTFGDRALSSAFKTRVIVFIERIQKKSMWGWLASYAIKLFGNSECRFAWL
jgi:hypothetical protein